MMAPIRSGGFSFAEALPEIDEVNFARHVTIRCSRSTESFPAETSQLPMFEQFRRGNREYKTPGL